MVQCQCSSGTINDDTLTRPQPMPRLVLWCRDQTMVMFALAAYRKCDSYAVMWVQRVGRRWSVRSHDGLLHHRHPLLHAVFAYTDDVLRRTSSTQWYVPSVKANTADHSGNCCQLVRLHVGHSTLPYSSQLPGNCDNTQAPSTTQSSAELSPWRPFAGAIHWTTFAAQCPHCTPLSPHRCPRVTVKPTASCCKPCASFIDFHISQTVCLIESKPQRVILGLASSLEKMMFQMFLLCKLISDVGDSLMCRKVLIFLFACVFIAIT